MVCDPKRRRVGCENAKSVGHSNWASPMLVENETIEEVGSGS